MEWYRLKLEGLKNSKIRVLMQNFTEYKDIFSHLNFIRTDLKFTDIELEIIKKSKVNEKY